MVLNKNSGIFVDSSFFKAFFDNKDDFHQEALTINQKLALENATLVTSNYILDETFTLLKVKAGLNIALALREAFITHKFAAQIFRVTAADDVKAWNWFIKPWKGLSFTDCTCFVLMERLGLTRVATFDRHFEKAGFTLE